MKNPKTYLFVFLGIIVLLALGHFFWMMQKSKTLDILFVNKSVENASANEMKTMNWVLNYNKILKSGNTHYQYSRDYFGFYPDADSKEGMIKSYSLADIPLYSESYDALFFVDNKGVDIIVDKEDPLPEHYGGFNQNDYLLFKSMLDQNKLIVAESNFFNGPTEELVRYNTEQSIDIYSLGWRGRFFKNLHRNKMEKEIGRKWIEQYKELYNIDWSYGGKGLVLVNEKQKRILVLPADKYMNDECLEIITPKEHAEKYHLPEIISYTGWFDIVFGGKNISISNFSMNLNPEGIELLKRNGIDSTFPAVIKHVNKNLYFLAGDFSKQKVFLASSRIRLLNDLIRGVCKNLNNQFFQNYYVPFFSSIFDTYQPTQTEQTALNQ